jgi:hypothetical protein
MTLTKGEKTYEVVGVVGDAKYNDLKQPARPTIYADLLQEDFLGSQLAIRTRIDPDGVAGAVRQTEADVLKNVPIVRMMGMNEQIDSTIVPQRLFATLSAGFGALGALLAVIGTRAELHAHLHCCSARIFTTGGGWPTAYSRTRSRGAHMRLASAWRSARQRLTVCR